jgi:hypothetical protein
MIPPPEDRAITRPWREDARDWVGGEGGDAAANKRRPLRMLGHFSLLLRLAVCGVAGTLPFIPDDPEPDAWAGDMAAAAKRF